MKREKVEIIQEAEALKVIVWYLKGLLDGKEEYETPLSRVHIEALQKAINYIYKETK